MRSFVVFLGLGACLGGYLGILEKKTRVELSKQDLEKTGKVWILTKADAVHGFNSNDTLILVPLKASNEFNESVAPLIKEGKLKITTSNAAPAAPKP